MSQWLGLLSIPHDGLWVRIFMPKDWIQRQESWKGELVKTTNKQTAMIPISKSLQTVSVTQSNKKINQQIFAGS